MIINLENELYKMVFLNGKTITKYCFSKIKILNSQMRAIYLLEAANFEGRPLTWEIRKTIIDNVKKLAMLV